MSKILGYSSATVTERDYLNVRECDIGKYEKIKIETIWVSLLKYLESIVIYKIKK